MKTLDLINLGTKHVRNAFSEELYLRTGRDITRPVSIFAEVVERCNYKCRYCDYWRRPNYRDEMSIDEWKGALASLKEFIGSYHIEFAGGEPYIKKGFIDLLEFCKEQYIHWGVTTNGGRSHFLRGDQEVITRHLFNKGIQIAEYSPKHVQRGSFSEKTNSFSPVDPMNIVLHWCGSYQKYIYFQMECLKRQSLINFF